MYILIPNFLRQTEKCLITFKIVILFWFGKTKKNKVLVAACECLIYLTSKEVQPILSLKELCQNNGKCFISHKASVSFFFLLF